MQLKYCLSEIRKKWKKKEWWVARISEYILHPICLKFTPGTNVLLEDWDYLVILDACRYDVFRDELRNWNIEGRLEYRISLGANTGLFVRNNFRKGILERLNCEIVYVTANPWVDKILKGRNNVKLISVWKYGWDEELGTVPPEPVYEAMLRAVSKYRGKRIVCHFLQPHGPCIKREGGRYIKIKGGIEAHRECLRTVMPFVERLCKILPGKVVVTSDHGDAFNDRVWFLPVKVWGHHPPLRIEPLIKVPWLIVDNRGRRIKVSSERELISSRVRRLRGKI